MTIRVLIVDDELGVAKALSRLLRKNAFDVQIAEGGEQALERLKAFEADVILTDLRMPHMDGVALLAEVQRLFPRIARIAMSGGGLESKAQTDPNIERLVPKPWNDKELVSLLHEVAPRPRE
jgi:CheY-like chemotaxis protein